MDRSELDILDRESLVQRAEAAGVQHARILTRPELIDELIRHDKQLDETQLKKSRGFFGIARDLLARVVERGLHLPDAADRLFGSGPFPPSAHAPPQAVPTLTLAEIYAAQGHKKRAVDTLRGVLDDEPDHIAARTLLGQLEDVRYVAPEPPMPPEPEIEIPKSEDTETAFKQSDVCIALPLPSGATYVWWRVSSKTREESAQAGDSFVVRAIAVVPSWEGPTISEHDCEVDPLSGQIVLNDLPAGAVVRVAIGVRTEQKFTPVAHSPALEMEADGAGERLVLWTLDGVVAVPESDPHLVTALANYSSMRDSMGSTRDN
ncbi:MAG: hypothetical protein FWD73_01440 [Polyangiaceae bacterium]|nr:hypothetical protein [Polyangiaceae bacterium]